jgi:hypothetical protein
VRFGDAAHLFRSWLIVEQGAAAAVDLQVDKSRRQKSIRRELALCPAGGNFSPRTYPEDAPISDQNSGVSVPAVAVENPLGQEGLSFDQRRVTLTWVHMTSRRAGLLQ